MKNVAPGETRTPKTTIIIMKNFAPGEARTPDLRISLSVLTYKYDALTDCATGAGSVEESRKNKFKKCSNSVLNIHENLYHYRECFVDRNKYIHALESVGLKAAFSQKIS